MSLEEKIAEIRKLRKEVEKAVKKLEDFEKRIDRLLSFHETIERLKELEEKATSPDEKMGLIEYRFLLENELDQELFTFSEDLYLCDLFTCDKCPAYGYCAFSVQKCYEAHYCESCPKLYICLSKGHMEISIKNE